LGVTEGGGACREAGKKRGRHFLAIARSIRNQFEKEGSGKIGSEQPERNMDKGKTETVNCRGGKKRRITGSTKSKPKTSKTKKGHSVKGVTKTSERTLRNGTHLFPKAKNARGSSWSRFGGSR